MLIVFWKQKLAINQKTDLLYPHVTELLASLTFVSVVILEVKWQSSRGRGIFFFCFRWLMVDGTTVPEISYYCGQPILIPVDHQVFSVQKYTGTNNTFQNFSSWFVFEQNIEMLILTLWPVIPSFLRHILSRALTPSWFL